MDERIPREGTYDFGLAPDESFEPADWGEEAFDLSRPHIMTALGPIDPGALGFCLPHEHLIARPLAANDPDLVLDDPAKAVQELEAFSLSGGRAVVDMSTADYGRDAAEILWVAQHTPVHVIVVTGHHKDLFAAPFLGESGIDAIADRSIRELTEGIGGLPLRAGVIKAGTSLNTITPVEARVLRAAARAAIATGAPISTHTERGTMAREQLAILQDEGADPRRVILCHLDFLRDEAALLGILEAGAFVSFDQFSKEQHGSDRDRATMLARLAAAGYGDRLLVSGDLSRRTRMAGWGGAPGLTYFLDHVPLLLMEAGLDAPAVRRIFIDNPAEALTIRRPA